MSQGEFSGQGTFTEASENTYQGEFAGGKYNGTGVYTFANGDRCKGTVRREAH